MRLDRYLANSHEGSRSEVKEHIRKGRVTVNGAVCMDPAAKITPGDEVCCNMHKVDHREHYYYMMNKPAGVISATEDEREKTVLDMFPDNIRKDLFPVGRLDKDSVGLLLVCDDGELSHRLLSPSSHVDKKYLIHTDEPLCGDDVRAFREGMTLDDGTKLQSALLEISDDDHCKAYVTIHEGKFHQIKRMISACGKKVTYLKRISMGSLVLDPALDEGKYRELTDEETEALIACADRQTGDMDDAEHRTV